MAILLAIPASLACKVVAYIGFDGILFYDVFRWWPAQIYNPRDVPTNIQNMRHQPGEFPVQFLGSHDYYWIHRGRVFSYQEGDKGSTDSGTNKNLAKVFKKGECIKQNIVLTAGLSVASSQLLWLATEGKMMGNSNFKNRSRTTAVGGSLFSLCNRQP